MTISSNKLGQLIAENDSAMLQKAFYETPDYRTLIESNDKIIVVGRRGTGKSALTHRLKNDWENGETKCNVYVLSPTEDQVIGLKPLLRKFGKYELIRAAVKIAWEACLLFTMIDKFSKYYKFEKCEKHSEVLSLKKIHYTAGKNIAFNLRSCLSAGLKGHSTPEEAIAEMSDLLGIDTLRTFTAQFFDASAFQVKYLIDCLDEGYEPDSHGVAYISGILQATVNVNSTFEKVRPIIFVRDNMYRAVAAKDPDYTRNLEGASLRLHWGENELLHMVSARLKYSEGIEYEKDIKVWNSVTTGSIAERAGFKKCLKLTLYRPRDLIALLNQAFYNASRAGNKRISEHDVTSTAQEISQSRLNDLKKEYEVIFPSLWDLINTFKGQRPNFLASEIAGRLQNFIDLNEMTSMGKRDLAFYSTPFEIINSLYGVGLIGIKDEAADVIKFCHDGKDGGGDVQPESVLNIHPCYQIALNTISSEFNGITTEDIHDDYEITVTSLNQEQRNRKVGQLINRLREISHGADDAAEFENWCLDAIKTIFPAELQNMRLHPNKEAPQRRDIVGTIVAGEGVWKRINEDYGTRCVIFEVKNFADLKPEHYRQLSSYLVDNYGNIGFIVYRSDRKEPCNDNELVWIREMYWRQEPKKLLVLLSHKHLVSYLEKIRNPQKHNAVDKNLAGILDSYHDLYLTERAGSKKSRK